MLGRLAEVLYWIGVGLGAIFELFGIALLAFNPDGSVKLFGGFCIIVGVVIYGIGRGIYYIVLGR